jgi:hypothetical protein
MDKILFEIVLTLAIWGGAFLVALISSMWKGEI